MQADPLGHGTIRKKARVTITLHLVQLTTNLSEGANLTFQLEVVAATGGHLGLDIVVEACIVLGGDNGILSRHRPLQPIMTLPVTVTSSVPP